MNNRLFLLPTLLLVVSGCAMNQWHCESDIASVAEACTRTQVVVMQSLPMECPYGADAWARVSARKDNPKDFTRTRSEAAINCKER